MGYTHYFEVTTKVSDEQWNTLTDAVKRIIAAATEENIELAFEYDNPSRLPCVDNNTIRFNGVGDEGHETFIIARDQGWEFCKTAQKPYDRVVVAVLTVAAEVIGLKVTSDGNASEWQPDVDWLNSILSGDFTVPDTVAI